MKGDSTMSQLIGTIIWYNKGICWMCDRDTEPVVEFNHERHDFVICSDCCQKLLAVHEQYDL